MPNQIRTSFLFLKFPALFLSLSLTLCNSFVFAQPRTYLNSPASQQPIDPGKVNIPKEMGQLKDSFKGKGDRTIILIQDAHAVPDAQKSIERLIGYFQNQYGVHSVALEGVKSQLDPQIFRSFPDKKALAKVFEKYQQNGELTGSTAAAIFNETPITYQGLEDWDLYQEGLDLYLEAMGRQSDILQNLDLEEKINNDLKKAIYSKEALEVDRLVKSFYKDSTVLPEVLKKLSPFKHPPAHSSLEMILNASEKEAESGLEAEAREKSEQIRNILTARGNDSRAVLRELNLECQKFKTSSISAQSFSLFLEKLIARERLPIKVSKRLSELANEEKNVQAIKGTKLFSDFESYVSSIYEALLLTNEQKKLNETSKKLRDLRSFAELSINREEWKRLKRFDSPLMSEDLFAYHFKFYHNAEKRDESFSSRLSKLLRTNKNIAAVIGGFHSEDLTQRMKDQGISYLLVSPHISSIPEKTNYQDRMRGHFSWGNYFQIENGKINFYKAFVQATRDQLLKESKIPREALLKSWRDQIILDLVEREKIAEARKYTAFIDEVSPNRKLSVVEHAEKFVQSLRRLKAEDQLTESNILNLLRASNIPTLETVALDPDAWSWHSTTSLGRVKDFRQKLPNRSELRQMSEGKVTEYRQVVLHLPGTGSVRVFKGEEENMVMTSAGVLRHGAPRADEGSVGHEGMISIGVGMNATIAGIYAREMSAREKVVLEAQDFKLNDNATVKPFILEFHYKKSAGRGKIAGEEGIALVLWTGSEYEAIGQAYELDYRVKVRELTTGRVRVFEGKEGEVVGTKQGQLKLGFPKADKGTDDRRIGIGVNYNATIAGTRDEC